MLRQVIMACWIKLKLLDGFKLTYMVSRCKYDITRRVPPNGLVITAIVKPVVN